MGKIRVYILPPHKISNPAWNGGAPWLHQLSKSFLYALQAHNDPEWLITRAAMSGPVGTFILDFHGTITKKDTINAIFNAVLAAQNRRGNDMSRQWQDIVARYTEDYQAHIQKYKPTEDERSTVEDEIQFYRDLREVEMRSFSRVSESGIFSGISEQELEELGNQAVINGDVVIRDGFGSFIQHINKLKLTWAVVSVNFSRAFVRGVLSSVEGAESNISILANQSDEHGVLKGPDGTVMTTSDAKLEAALGLIGPNFGKEAKNKVVYVGDSGTDIECLLLDGIIGIIISDDERGKLLKTMERIKINVLHIGEYVEDAHKTVYWARDYSEIIQSPLLS
jgi:2-hydroxy-3-keto-5-methylthiopentenyl-1-phosphate phosphatase